MFNNIKDFLAGASLSVDLEGKPTQRDLQLSVIVLLLSIAHSDSNVSPDEINAITGTAFKELGLSDHEAGDLLEVSDFLLKEKTKLDEFIKNINEGFDLDQKQLLMAMVWKILIADGKAEKHEAALATSLRNSLGLSMEQNIRARKIAEVDKLHTMADTIVKSSDSE